MSEREEMTKSEEILAKYPSVRLGLDEHYGKQTVLNALNEALRIQNGVSGSFSRVGEGQTKTETIKPTTKKQ